jgi:dTDP-4-dehydrorhamnose 3,5-epimerase
MEFVRSQKLPGLVLIKPDVHEDYRGDHVMTYNHFEYHANGIHPGLFEFMEHCVCTSRKGVLRGIHADFSCDKLYEIVCGRAYYVFVDCQEGPTFGRWEAFILTGQNHHVVYKPRRYGAGFLALSDHVVLYYKQSQYYDPARQVTYRWDDSRFGIRWPVRAPILSERDACGPFA